MSKLKPCPFCGGEAEIIKPNGPKIDTRTMPYRVAMAVACTNIDCGANMGNWYERTEAIAAWNRRAEPANEPLTCKGCTHYYDDDTVSCQGCKRLIRANDLYTEAPNET